MKSVRVLITGRVQGLGFRDWLTSHANRLLVHGWVRNVGYNQVEALLCGDEAAIEACLALCRRGPPASRVDNVASQPAPEPAGPAAGFVRLPSI